MKARVLALLFMCAGCEAATASTEADQPIAFNHQLHVGKEKIPCTDCHVGAEKSDRAGLPSLTRCLLCHMKPQGKRPSTREREVRAMAARGEKVRFRQVTRNEGHVYFSHRVHTKLAGFSCTRCHGDVRNWKRPPTEPNAKLMSMSRCMSCHRHEGASNRCSACHH